MAQERERLLGDGAEPLPALGGIGVRIGGGLPIPARLGERRGRRGKRVLCLGITGLETGDETLGERGVIDPQGGAHQRWEHDGVGRVVADAGVRLQFGEKSRPVLADPNPSEGGRPQPEEDVLRVFGLAGDGLEPVGHPGHLSVRISQSEDPRLDSTDRYELEDVPASLQARRHVVGKNEHLIVLTRILERIEHARC